MSKKNIPILLLYFTLLQSCIVPNKSFVASSFEPLTVKQKGDLEVSASVRPFKFYKFNETFAITNAIALRAGYSGFPGLDNFDASLIFFKNVKNLGFFVAPTYNYQHNSISRSYSFSFYGVGRDFRYNSVYNSPGIVLGSSFSSKKGNAHHLIIKTSYNIVSRYSYYFSSNTASGKDGGFYVKDAENLNYKIDNFFTFEPSYSFVVARPSRKMAIRYQLGFNFCQTVLVHHYTFATKSYGGPATQDATNLHPTSFPINVSIGFIFKHSFKSSPKNE